MNTAVPSRDGYRDTTGNLPPGTDKQIIYLAGFVSSLPAVFTPAACGIRPSYPG